jgi:hypothetical protein
VAVLLALAVAPATAPAALRAGVASVDGSWHVGASAGQYASDGGPVSHHGVDPHTHSTRRQSSYGMQSRLAIRALVVEGSDGRRVAVVKNDLYIPQDLLYRRTAQLLEAGRSGIRRENLVMAVTHNHSSPYYSSTSPGVWTFQDVYDVRFFDYYAKRMAAAVEKAAASLKPVRVGASVTKFDKTHRHSYGGTVADDGTPAGYPYSDSDHDMVVVRFDDVTNPAAPKPLANLVNYSLHPEMLEGNDLISADYLAPLQRMVERRTGAMTVFTQNAVGTSEAERSTHHSIHSRLEFYHRQYGQSEYAARLMADVIADTAADIERRTPADPSRFVPFTTDAPVAMEDRWFPGPLSHPYPGVSSCRTDPAAGGDPVVPVVGLPDCVRASEGPERLADVFGFPAPPKPPDPPIDPGVSTDDLQRAGIPVPENLSVPSYGGLEEDVSVHLQAFRIGEILFPVCSCEQWHDQSENIETRTNRRQGDQYLGFDWGARCTRLGDGRWSCPDPRNEAKRLPPVSDHAYQRMRAQVRNDASGWDAPEYAPYAESEPVDPKQIKGNFTHAELPPERGYTLTVPIGMANDYNGYIVSYREYQRGDHYRKALNAWGPHASDYMATRLVRMAGHLKGGPDLPAEPLQEKVAVDLALNDRRAAALGEAGATSIRSYEAGLPDDGGPVGPVKEPGDIERFAATSFSWNGGSNFTDDPKVRVERKVRGSWQRFADQSGEVPVTLRFPQGEEVASYLLGSQRWTWTAHFEAFAANFDTGAGRATPPGEYRFVVSGLVRRGRRPQPYTVMSKAFTVRPWDGITVEDVRVSRTGTVSYRVGPRRTLEVPRVGGGGGKIRATIGPIDYPDSYKSSIEFIHEERTALRDPAAPNDPGKLEWFCWSCRFRPWADTGNARSGYVTVRRRVRTRTRSRRARRAQRTVVRVTRVRAVRRGDRWYARNAACGRATFAIAAGAVRDRFGNLNGQGTAPRAVRARSCPVAKRKRKRTRRPSRRRQARRPSFTG